MKSRFFLITTCLIAFVVAVSMVKAEEPKKAAEKPAAESAEPKGAEVKKAVDQAAAVADANAPKKPSGTPVALTMEALQELEDRKVALDAREQQMNERTRDLELQEKILKEKLKKMEDLNKRMADRLDKFKKDHDDRIAKLVTVVEGMKPEAAARYVEALEPELAVEILARIKETKASKILNLADKKMGAKLTELYTGYRESGAADKAADPQKEVANSKPN